MFILNQTKDCLYELKGICVYDTYIHVNGKEFGEYETNEKAKKVLEDIINCLDKDIPTYKLPEQPMVTEGIQLQYWNGVNWSDVGEPWKDEVSAWICLDGDDKNYRTLDIESGKVLTIK